MNKDYEEFLEKYILSKDVKNALQSEMITFSDWDRATIVWNSGDILENKWEEIRKICDSTKDKTLKSQIVERLKYDNDALKIFKEKNNGFIYALSSNKFNPKDCIVSYYANCDLAYSDGCKLGFPFAITKHQMVDEKTIRIKGRNYLSPLVEPDESKQIVEHDEYEYGVAQVEYDKFGKVLSYRSYELTKDRDLKVNTLSNKRFERRFVAFPMKYKSGDKVHILEKSSKNDKNEGWVSSMLWDYADFVKHATEENAIENYMDAAIPINYWDHVNLKWDLRHVNPIYLERVDDKMCNSFDKNGPIIIGHDSGDAVWIQVVQVPRDDRILCENVSGIGIEISVEKSFFNRLLRPLFMKVFNPDLDENKKRYTYAFNEEGRYLTAFEEGILEHNFFTVEQVEAVIGQIRNVITDGTRLIENVIGGTDAIQLLKLYSHLQHIIRVNYKEKIISVMS